jgi:beta-lactamase regulating signal transducer with metallopeptidase domain
MNLDILSLSKINIPSVDISNSVSQNTGYSFEKYISSISYLWILIVFIIVIYNILSYIRLKNKLIGAIKLEKNIYLADYIKTPFVIGLFKPKIYLPSIMKEDEIKSVILHEKVHIKRLDYIIKIIAFLIAIIYWFILLIF